MINRFTSLTINSHTYTEYQLASFCLSKLSSESFSSWEYSLYTFILDWISSMEIISVNTSGSTGKPRQIEIKKDKMVHSALLTGDFFKLKKNDKALLCLPVDFIAGKMMVVRAFVLGLNLFPVEPAGNPLKNLVEDFDFTAFTPMQVFNVLNVDKGNQKLNLIKNVIIGGGNISEFLSKKILNLQNNTFHTYGMTETITHVALKKLTGNDNQKYFLALPGIQFEKDERSCLIIKARHLSNEKIITNDVVELINTGEFKFVGRYDNIIISGGVKIFPEKVEQNLELFIKQQFIITGLPDEKLGQKVILIIEGSDLENIEIEEICRKAGITKYETPKEVYIIDNFPKTKNGKIKREEVLKMITAKHRIGFTDNQ